MVDSTPTATNPFTGKRTALVIGVNAEASSTLPQLTSAEADAVDIAEVLQHYCHFQLLMPPLVGENATSDKVRKAVLRLARERGDDDFLLLYFSGHGQPMNVEAGRQDIFLVTHDFDEVEVGEDENAHISMRWLREKLYIATGASKVLVILDCCYAGNMGRTADDQYLKELQQRVAYYFEAPGADTGARSGGLRFALSATGHNAVAKEENGHGLMTGLLLPALRGEVTEVIGSDGQVSIQLLDYYLETRMPPDQRPSISGDSAAQSCILAYYPERRQKRVESKDIIESKVLTAGMTALPTDYAVRIQNFLAEYLGAAMHPVPFGGRDVDLARLNTWLDNGQDTPYLMLAAPAGRGKSALLVRWSQQLLTRKELAVAFLPVSGRFRTNLASVVFPALTARLANLHGEKVPANPDTPLEVWRGLMSDYLSRSLPDGRRLLLVLDGVDEAADWEIGADIFPLAPPKGLQIVVSARYLAGDVDARPWLGRLGWSNASLARALDLQPLTSDGVADVLRHMNFAEPVWSKADIIKELHRLSEGDPLLVRLYVDELWDKREAVTKLTPEQLSTLRPGLQGYFDRWWEDQRILWGEKTPLREPGVQALLSMLACALGPLLRTDILKLAPPEASLTNWTLDGYLQPLQRFVIGDGRRQGYVFNHPRLGVYFYEEWLTPQDRQAMQSRIFSWGKDTLKTLNEGLLSPKDASPYIVQYYGAHLERAGRGAEDFLPLVSNGWRQAWEQLEGTYAGFLSDTGRAWRAFEQCDQQAVNAGQLASFIGSEIRCALCQGSVNSLANNIPPALLLEVVKKGIWTPSQALTYARHLPDPEQRAKVLIMLTPSLTDTQKDEVVQEVLETVQAVEPKGLKARVLVEIAQHLSEPLKGQIIQEALDLARTIEDQYNQRLVRSLLMPHLTESIRKHLMQEMLNDIPLEQDTNNLTWEAITSTQMLLISYLPEAEREQVIQDVLKLEHQDADVYTLVLIELFLIPYMAGPLREQIIQEILSFARLNKKEEEIVLVLTAVVPYLVEPFRGQFVQEMLDMRFNDEENLMFMKFFLIPHLLEPLRGRIIQEVLQYMDKTYEADDADDTMLMQTSLVPYLKEPLRGQIIQNVLKILRTSENMEYRTHVLTELVSYLQLRDVLEIVRVIKDDVDQIQTSVALASSLSDAQQQEILATIRSLRDEALKAQFLTQVLSDLSETRKDAVIQEILKVVRKIRDKTLRIYAFIALIPFLSVTIKYSVVRETLATVLTIEGETVRLEALYALVPHLPQIELDKVVRIAHTIQDARWQAWLLTRLLPYVPMLEEENIRAGVLATIGEITSVEDQALALERLVSYLSELELQEVLGIARQMQDKVLKVRLLTSLLPYLPTRLKAEAVQEALETMWIMDWENEQVRAIEILLPYLSMEQLQIVLDHSRRMTQKSKAHLLVTFLSYLPETMKDEVAQEAVEAAWVIEDEDKAAEVDLISRFLPSLVEWRMLMRETIVYEGSRAQVLTKLIPYLPESQGVEVMSEALEAAQTIGQKDERARVLIELAPYLEKLSSAVLYQNWSATLRILARSTRQNLLANVRTLTPIIKTLGGEKAIVETYQAIQDVARWWP